MIALKKKEQTEVVETPEPAARDNSQTPEPGHEPLQDAPVTLEELTATVKALSHEVAQLKERVEAWEYPPGTTPGRQEDSPPPEEPPKSTRARVVSILGNILFYVVIVGILAGAFLLRSASSGRPFMFAGYSAATVLTSSMEDVYPKGSLIVTKSVDANTLEIGDDITYMVNENSTFTHRIVGITEDFQGTGKRGFETKGTMNATADREKVAAANVVGKVVFSSVALGSIANFVKGNWPLLLFITVVLMVLVWVLKRVFREEPPEQKHGKEPQKG